MSAKILSHEERLEITRRKMVFRENMKHAHEVPAALGAEEHPEPVFDENHCPYCGGDLMRFEGCYCCKKCGWSRC